ncbi:hypothetical protein [Phenylobacterium sp. J367]|uniref:hypothetical protein n=1 Tax=Phenylobacterium sp. J367 TaxID=2898435 RepID=UPI00215160E7|nr:hypothetical protein [Phenylobacterium sp. J367]MCR5880798.1 hypothetical protein [Phenylobacterium sp. J367]
MRIGVIMLAAGAAFSANAVQAAEVEIRDAVARVTVIPEDRADIKVEIVKSHPQLPLQVRVAGDRTVIDGDLDDRIRSCNGRGGKGDVKVRGVGSVDHEDMPQVVVRTPRAVEISSNSAISGAVGRSASLKLSNAGCSRWTVADVAGDATIRESGAGWVRMGASEHLTVHLSGAGGVEAAKVRNGLEANLSGAGGVKIREFSGAMAANVAGVGKVEVEHGSATSLKASVAGVGGIEFGGPVDTLDASIAGFGGVRVQSVKGSVRKSVSGIGKVTIEDRT